MSQSSSSSYPLARYCGEVERGKYEMVDTPAPYVALWGPKCPSIARFFDLSMKNPHRTGSVHVPCKVHYETAMLDVLFCFGNRLRLTDPFRQVRIEPITCIEHWDVLESPLEMGWPIHFCPTIRIGVPGMNDAEWLACTSNVADSLYGPVFLWQQTLGVPLFRRPGEEPITVEDGDTLSMAETIPGNPAAVAPSPGVCSEDPYGSMSDAAVAAFFQTQHEWQSVESAPEDR